MRSRLNDLHNNSDSFPIERFSKGRTAIVNVVICCLSGSKIKGPLKPLK
jgi:hypothetical protein